MWRRACLVTLAVSTLFAVIPPISPAQESTGVESESKVEDPDKKEDELDRLLNLDLEQLSHESVASRINPIVEGVSKKSETLTESPAVAQVITAEEIRAFGAKNLFEVLNWATSVYTSGSYLFPDNVVSIRGDIITHDDNHRLVLINGRPVRDVQEGGLNSSIYLAFPLDAIHHVEIIRGPGSVLYGSNAYTGVINIVTKTADEPTGRGATLAGSFGTQKYDLTQGNGNDNGGYFISTTYGRQEGWPFTATGEGPPVQNPAVTGSTLRGYEDAGLFAQVYRGNFTATTFVASTSQTHLGAVPTWPTGRADDLDMDRVFVDLGYTIEPSFGGKTDLHFTYNFLGHKWQLPALIESNSHSYLVEGTHYQPIADDVDLVIGAFTDIHQGEATVVPGFVEIWYSTYAQLEYAATDWLKLIGGIQGNFPGEVEAGVAPRAGAIMTLSENWGAKLLYGNAFRSPSALERSIVAPPNLIGNPDLTPETVTTYEAQLAHTTENSRQAVTYYFSEFHELIRRVGTFPPTLENGGSIKFHGVEVETIWDPNDHWHYLGSLTWQENIDDQGVVDSTLVPNWMGKVGVAYDNCSGLKIGLFDILFSKPKGVDDVNPLAAIVNTPEDAINLLSLDVRYDVSRWVPCGRGRTAEVQLLVQNLLDDDINHPEFNRKRINTLPAGAGRSFYGGFSVEY